MQPKEAEIQKREAIMERIDYWHTILPTMGSRKILAKLREEGFAIGRKLVRKYMSLMGIYAIYPKENLSQRNYKEGILPYLLRNYEASEPNQVWSIDITFIKMKKGHMYLTGIIDWYSRKIVGWNLSDTLSTKVVMMAVKEAIEKNGKPEIINSDQGSQFTSKEYQKLLQDLQIKQSMDGKSRWADNVMIERWFRSLKTELIYINEFKSPKELRKGINDYIEKYNGVRPHQALKYSTPDAVYEGVVTA